MPPARLQVSLAGRGLLEARLWKNIEVGAATDLPLTDWPRWLVPGREEPALFLIGEDKLGPRENPCPDIYLLLVEPDVLPSTHHSWSLS